MIQDLQGFFSIRFWGKIIDPATANLIRRDLVLPVKITYLKNAKFQAPSELFVDGSAYLNPEVSSTCLAWFCQPPPAPNKELVKEIEEKEEEEGPTPPQKKRKFALARKMKKGEIKASPPTHVVELYTVTLPKEGIAIGLPQLLPMPPQGEGDEADDGPATFPRVLFRTRTVWDDTPIVKALRAKAPSVAFALA